MNWLAQNWEWVALAIGVVWLFRQVGLARCEMSADGIHETHCGGSGNAADARAAEGGSVPNQGHAAGDKSGAGLQSRDHNATSKSQKHRHRGCC